MKIKFSLNYVNICELQTLAGINGSMASNATLPSAIRKTVADILKISEKYISMPVISSARRVLLSGMYVSYDVNLTSTRTPESYKVALMDSVRSGGFVEVLHAKSGVLLERTYDLYFVDFSPTSAPTRSPVSTLLSKAGKIDRHTYRDYAPAI